MTWQSGSIVTMSFCEMEKKNLSLTLNQGQIRLDVLEYNYCIGKIQ